MIDRFKSFLPLNSIALGLTQGEAADAPDTLDCTQNNDGQYRIANTNAIGYLIYVGVNGPPDFTKPANAFNVNLPLTLSWPLPGSGIVTLHVVARFRNAYGLISQNSRPTLIRLTPSGKERLPVPMPLEVSVLARPGAAIRVMASYPTRRYEADPANKMRVWVSSGVIDTNAGATNVTDITNDLAVTEFGSYAPGTYNVAVAFHRTVDAATSAAVHTTVTFPELPDAPEAVLTDDITP